MIFCVFIFIFCLEPTVREQLDENDFCHCYVIFSKLPSWKYLIKPCSNFFRNNCKRLWQRHFEAIHYNWRFYGHGSPYKLIFSWVNIFKRKSAKVPELIYLHDNPACASKNIAQTHFTYYCMLFSQINLVYKFHILLFR